MLSGIAEVIKPLVEVSESRYKGFLPQIFFRWGEIMYPSYATIAAAYLLHLKRKYLDSSPNIHMSET